MLRQESPPAWTQEAYRPPCRKYSLCCPNWVPPNLAGGVPDLGTPHRVPTGRVPSWQGTPSPQQGTPRRVPPWAGPGRVPPRLDLAGYPPWLDLAGYPPPHPHPPTHPTPSPPHPQPPPPVAAPWHSGKCCKALWDMGTPPRCEQTNKVKLLPSRRSTYAGGKNVIIFKNNCCIWTFYRLCKDH